MRTIPIILSFTFILFFSYFSNAQETVQKESDMVYTAVEKAPEFPGGAKAFSQFLSNKLFYPKEAIKHNVTGKVILKFVVSKEGYISNITVLKSLGYGCDEAAIFVLSLSPKWTPGMHLGKNVDVSYSIPFVFSLPY